MDETTRALDDAKIDIERLLVKLQDAEREREEVKARLQFFVDQLPADKMNFNPLLLDKVLLLENDAEVGRAEILRLDADRDTLQAELAKAQDTILQLRGYLRDPIYQECCALRQKAEAEVARLRGALEKAVETLEPYCYQGDTDAKGGATMEEIAVDNMKQALAGAR